MTESIQRLQTFVANLFELEGAIIEPIEPLGLEYLATPALQAQLRIAETGRLGFGTELAAGTQRVGLETDWLERLGQVLGERGTYLHCRLPVSLPKLATPERILEHGITLHNAIYRLVTVVPAQTRYLVLLLRYTAYSDEKRDGMLQLGVNLATSSMLDGMTEALLQAVFESGEPINQELPPQALPLPVWEASRLTRWLERALPDRVQSQLHPFLVGMHRRLERDLGRIRTYHTDLQNESRTRLKKPGADLERERLRLEAIRREYEAKVGDLRQKYAMRIEVEWIQTLELVLPVHRFELIVKRRKGERKIALDWNPVTRKLEPLVCESSFTFEPGRIVCDVAMHIVSRAAHAPCAQCGKEFCRACSPRKCPKCGHNPTLITELAQS